MKTRVRPYRPEIITYNFIVDYKKSHDGNSPSLREICIGTYVSSTNTISVHIDKLINFGKLKKINNKIVVVGGVWIPPQKDGKK